VAKHQESVNVVFQIYMYKLTGRFATVIRISVKWHGISALCDCDCDLTELRASLAGVHDI